MGEEGKLLSAEQSRHPGTLRAARAGIQDVYKENSFLITQN